MAVHKLIGRPPLPACGAHKRHRSSQIIGTRGGKFDCKRCVDTQRPKGEAPSCRACGELDCSCDY